MQIDKIQAYELLQEEQIQDIHAKGYLLRHKKSGARVMLIENEDENKVFNIAFRTPPVDSTGVAHIIEHSVLCGSKEFPLKDPFVELAKGSLNTFLNAMTYPDKTMYPIASCNDQDFRNLMHVYLDAVFHPNIYQHEEIFRQEGWSYQLESKDAPLTYNGVVYSEMKGVFSSPEELLDRTIFSSLFPDTTYGIESGGDPDFIPDLTYDEFLAFHKRYYHPSNSYIYLYGDMDFEERLQWMDEKYLSKYDKIQIDSHVPEQKPFAAIKEQELEYPITDNEEEENNSYLSYNVVVGDALDVELGLAFNVLDYALLSAPGAPVKQILLDEKIGKDILGSYQDGILQPFFSIVAKNAKLQDKQRFVCLIQDTLEKLANEGIDKKSLEAGINYLEFRFREADFSSYPKGLMYGLDTFDSWLYDDTKPFDYLKQIHVFEALKVKVKGNYFEDLIKTYLLQNTHASIVTLKPKKGLAGEKEAALKEKLSAYKATLTEEELEVLVEKTKGLVAYQEAKESEEALECIPMLKRSDIKTEAMKLYNKAMQIDTVKVLHHDVDTNQIAYLHLLYDTKQVPNHLVPYLGLLKSVLGYVDTKHFGYAQLFNEINANTGGIYCGMSVFNGNDKVPYQGMFGIKAKCLFEKIPFIFEMMEEIITTSNLESEKRIYEIIAQTKSRLQMTLSSAGHSTAAARATSYFSPLANFQEQYAGIDYYHFIDELERNYEEKKLEIFGSLNILRSIIFTKNNLLLSVTANEEGFEAVTRCIDKFNAAIETLHETTEEEKTHLALSKKNEGFMTPGQVQYVAKAGNFKDKGFAFTGALHVLRSILSYDYLWNEVRVKGGAYGCMNAFKRSGDTFFVSYRDPKLKETLAVYNQIPNYIRDFEADEREMTKYIIGTISGLDTPLTPASKGSISLTAYLNGISEADLQKERDEILNAQVEDIHALAKLVEAVLNEENICVIGAEQNIEQAKDLFMEIKNLV